MKFIHYSGAGNTFLLADNREEGFAYDQASTLCHKADVDGVILLENSSKADAYMRIFNRDGSEAEMCGNGLRCFVKYLQELGIKKETYQIHSLAGLYSAWCVKDEVCVQTPPPTDLKLNLAQNMHAINTGVPHGVCFVDSVEAVQVVSEGRALRHSVLFAPEGANINFVSVQKEGFLTVRTYERGVEGETLACGTGAIAASLIAHALHYLPSPIDVWVRSGDILKITFNSFWTEITLQGPATRIRSYEGEELGFNINSNSATMAHL